MNPKPTIPQVPGSTCFSPLSIAFLFNKRKQPALAPRSILQQVFILVARYHAVTQPTESNNILFNLVLPAEIPETPRRLPPITGAASI
jgi:hypothetical protein